MPTIYRKTSKGQSEIETRAHRLTPRFRSLLILVDGRRGDDELQRLLPQVGATALATLVEGGFIEPTVGPAPVPITAPPPAPMAAPAAPTAAAPPPETAPPQPPPLPASKRAPALPLQPAPQATSERELPTLPLPPPAAPVSRPVPLDDRPLPPWVEHQREEAVRDLLLLCGPLATPLARRMESARTNEELNQLLDVAIQLVATTRGRQPALDYGTRFKGG